MESFNYHRLAGKTLTAQRLAETVDALPMMSPRTLIVVQDYDLFKAPEGERKAITQLLEDLPEYCCLVFVYDTLAYKRDARMKKLAGVLQDKAGGPLPPPGDGGPGGLDRPPLPGPGARH